MRCQSWEMAFFFFFFKLARKIRQQVCSDGRYQYVLRPAQIGDLVRGKIFPNSPTLSSRSVFPALDPPALDPPLPATPTAVGRKTKMESPIEERKRTNLTGSWVTWHCSDKASPIYYHDEKYS